MQPHHHPEELPQRDGLSEGGAGALPCRGEAKRLVHKMLSLHQSERPGKSSSFLSTGASLTRLCCVKTGCPFTTYFHDQLSIICSPTVDYLRLIWTPTLECSKTETAHCPHPQPCGFQEEGAAQPVQMMVLLKYFPSSHRFLCLSYIPSDHPDELLLLV